jgi:hypothetical protein
VDTDVDRIFYIAQRAAKGKSLEDLVSGGWRVSEEKVKRVALEVRIMGSLQDCFDMDIEALSVFQ